jgi:hypothetical protein
MTSRRAGGLEQLRADLKLATSVGICIVERARVNFTYPLPSKEKFLQLLRILLERFLRMHSAL